MEELYASQNGNHLTGSPLNRGRVILGSPTLGLVGRVVVAPETRSEENSGEYVPSLAGEACERGAAATTTGLIEDDSVGG